VRELRADRPALAFVSEQAEPGKIECLTSDRRLPEAFQNDAASFSPQFLTE
jgi:hypothetical protein